MCFAYEPIENGTKTLVLRWNLWKTQRKHKCCVGTYRKRKENRRSALEPMENERKTQVLRWNQWKRQENTRLGAYGKRKENTGFAWEPMENARNT